MFDWKRIKLIAGREVKTTLGKRTYRISLIVQMVIVALLAMTPIFIAMFRSDDSGTVEPDKIAVVDMDNATTTDLVSSTLQTLVGSGEATFEVSSMPDADAATKAVSDGDLDAAMIVTREGTNPDFRIITSDGDADDSLAQLLVTVSTSVAIQQRIDATGLSAAQMQTVFASPEVSVTTVASDDDVVDSNNAGDIANYVIAYASTIIIFIFVVMYGQWISQGVVEEKASRIMEIMVNAATPRDLLAGKVIGIMITALMQFVPLVLTVGVIASFQTEIGGLLGVDKDQLFDFNFGAIAWSAMGWFLLYFILGFLLYGSLYAGVGSMVSRQEEVSTAVAPMTTVMMVGYFAALASLSNPDGMIARISYLFPGTSVFVAMLRLINGNPYWWEIAISIGGLIVAIILAMMLAARLYRVGVLMYGQAPSFKTLFNLKGAQQVAR